MVKAFKRSNRNLQFTKNINSNQRETQTVVIADRKQIFRLIVIQTLDLYVCSRLNFQYSLLQETSNSNIEIIEKYQNIALRTILGIHHYQRNADIPRDLEIIAVEDRSQSKLSIYLGATVIPGAHMVIRNQQCMLRGLKKTRLNELFVRNFNSQC